MPKGIDSRHDLDASTTYGLVLMFGCVPVMQTKEQTTKRHVYRGRERNAYRGEVSKHLDRFISSVLINALSLAVTIQRQSQKPRADWSDQLQWHVILGTSSYIGLHPTLRLKLYLPLGGSTFQRDSRLDRLRASSPLVSPYCARQ